MKTRHEVCLAKLSSFPTTLLKRPQHISTSHGAWQNATVPAMCSGAANDFQWRLVNGLWGLILALGLLWSALTVRKARTWLYFKSWVRSLLADYGVPLLVVIWSAVGYCIYPGTPDGVPRQAIIYNTWDVKNNWAVARVNGRFQLALLSDGSVCAMLPQCALHTVLFIADTLGCYGCCMHSGVTAYHAAWHNMGALGLQQM